MKTLCRNRAHFATVIRSGQPMDLPTEQLVRGDLVALQLGNRVPADIRICEAVEFATSECMDEVSCLPISTTSGPFRRQKFAYSSTIVLAGSARGIVIATGNKTFFGRIAAQCCATRKPKYLIAQDIQRLMRINILITIIFGVLLFLVALSYNFEFRELVLLLAALIIAHTPKLLLPMLAASLSISARRLLRKNCFVKSPQIIETLACTSFLCVHKTALLTQNCLSIAHVWVNDELFKIEGDYAQPLSADVPSSNTTLHFEALKRAVLLCNNAHMQPGQEHLPTSMQQMRGNDWDVALLKFLALPCEYVLKFQRYHPTVAEIPYNSRNRCHVTIHEIGPVDEPRYLLVMKGAPEVIIERSFGIYVEGADLPLNADMRKKLYAVCAQLRAMNESTLCFCDLLLPADKYPNDYAFDTDELNFPLNNLRFIGLVSVSDAARTNVSNALAKCRSAGIKVIMITDEPVLSALEFAKNVGIIPPHSTTVALIDKSLKRSVAATEEKAAVIDGSELSDMDRLQELLLYYDDIVFARTTRLQKGTIVEACQRLKQIVAITGTALGDAPALKQADVGISLNMLGSNSCKQAADLILLDDSLASLVYGIEEARISFDNSKKCVAYALTSHVPQVAALFIMICFYMPLPLGVAAMLCVDVIVNWSAISLMHEPAEADTMHRPPFTVAKDGLSHYRLILHTYGYIAWIETAAAAFCFFVAMSDEGFRPSHLLGKHEEWNDRNISNFQNSHGKRWSYSNRKILQYSCQTAFFAAIVVAQCANLIVCKTFRKSVLKQGMHNWQLNCALGFQIVLTVLLCNHSFIDVRLRTIEYSWWAFAIPFAIVIFFGEEIRKKYLRNNPDCGCY